MKIRLRQIIVVANTILVLGCFHALIAKKQGVLDSGLTIYLELAPVDPRSLIQGDYMVLNYALGRERNFIAEAGERGTRGKAILQIGEDRVGTYSRIEPDDGESLSDSEIRLRYRKWRRGFRFGIESFFFEEGTADQFSSAQYAEVKVSNRGEPVLVDLHENLPE